MAGDALGSGFVDSLARPGGNVTGLTLQSPELVGKRLNLLRKVLPGRRRLAVMANVGYPAAKQELAQVEAVAGALGFEVVALEITRPEDIAPAFDGIKDRADVLYVAIDALLTSNGTPYQHAGFGRSTAGDVRLQQRCRSRLSALLWAKLSRPGSANRRAGR